MSKKFILLLSILFLAITCLIYVRFFYIIASPTAPVVTLQSAPGIQPESSIYILPNPHVINASENTSLDVMLQTNLRPTLAQIELAYDPVILSNVSVIPGDYFLSPEVVLEKIDFKNGRISYALLGISKADAAQMGKIATINFTPLNYGLLRQTSITFLPKTSIKNGSLVIGLKNMVGTTLTVKPSFFAPVATPSAAQLAPNPI